MRLPLPTAPDGPTDDSDGHGHARTPLAATSDHVRTVSDQNDGGDMFAVIIVTAVVTVGYRYRSVIGLPIVHSRDRLSFGQARAPCVNVGQSSSSSSYHGRRARGTDLH